MANRHPDSDHPSDLAIRRAARLSVRHDFHAFSALRSADLRPATFGHDERRVDEAFFFVQRPFAKCRSRLQSLAKHPELVVVALRHQLSVMRSHDGVEPARKGLRELLQ
jgi:hypothetical protein